MPTVKSNDTLLSRLVPFGLVGQTKPQHYREMLGVLWENRSELPYAWNILNHGVCDGCSLGPYGLRDNVLDGVHLMHVAAQVAQAQYYGRARSVGHERCEPAEKHGAGATALAGPPVASDAAPQGRTRVFTSVLARAHWT